MNMSWYQELVTSSIAALESLRGLEGPVEQAVVEVAGCLAGGRKVLTCGNGGSAADASHLATELVVRFEQDRQPYPAICLNDSGSTLTAAGNDYGFDEVFARQVGAFGGEGDVLIAFTTSGRSKNVVRALEEAGEAGVRRVALLGRDGGLCKGLAEVTIRVPCESTARVQEAHGVLIHALCQAVERRLASEPDHSTATHP